uniref:Uncharacterized protein n=1 Tax=Globodera rostochiensis TaxID=31243 RepID=A0A914ICM1_GLORO
MQVAFRIHELTISRFVPVPPNSPSSGFNFCSSFTSRFFKLPLRLSYLLMDAEMPIEFLSDTESEEEVNEAEEEDETAGGRRGGDTEEGDQKVHIHSFQNMVLRRGFEPVSLSEEKRTTN